MVQWLGICQPMQGPWVWSLVQKDPTCHLPKKSTIKSGYERDKLLVLFWQFLILWEALSYLNILSFPCLWRLGDCTGRKALETNLGFIIQLFIQHLTDSSTLPSTHQLCHQARKGFSPVTQVQKIPGKFSDLSTWVTCPTSRKISIVRRIVLFE